jgi:acetyltransferase EpsM
MSKTIAVIGAGGHCSVVLDIIKLYNNYKIVGIYDDYRIDTCFGYSILGKIDELDTSIENFVMAIGDDKTRKIIYRKYPGLKWCTLIHPSCVISHSSVIGEGSVICAGSILQPYVRIGKHCIVNTNSNIDHESTVGDFCSICPGVSICGRATIGDSCFIGANATIIQNINIGDNCIIGAGTVVIRNIDESSRVVGNPARKINR